MQDLLNIIFEDSEMLVVNKPSGLVCHPTKGDEYSSLISRVRLYLDGTLKSVPALDAPPGHSAHLINRLDRETSGLVLLGKNPESAGSLGKAFEARTVQKEYLAIVHGHVKEASGNIATALGKDLNSVIHIKDCVTTEGALSETGYSVLNRFENEHGRFSLLKINPKTGRKHQIRIHLQHIGHSIVGDKMYGGNEDLYMALVQNRLTDDQRKELLTPAQTLHASRLQFTWRNFDYDFSAPPEKWFIEFAQMKPTVLSP
ncbi:MAG: pseudouridine synthase [Verrucomicrobiales bacterium]|nr:pseudouridine synthase [Verrucomicrobiales bacterium]